MSIDVNVSTGTSLPNGWREKKDADGKLYYVDDVSERTTWARPTEPSLPNGWSVR